MTLIIMRIFFTIISAVVGYQVGSILSAFGKNWPLIGAAIGFGGSVLVVLLEFFMKKVSVRGLSAAVFGLLFGLIVAKLLTDSFILVSKNETFGLALQVVLTLIFCYLGMIIAIRGRDEFSIIIPYVRFSAQDQRKDIIILDTSVIIDGRIADMAQTRFLDGRFVIPGFVLKELQQIADSQDPLKRNRGRRGLEILNKIKKNSNIDLKIHEEDFPEINEVDAKLVKLAKVLSGRIFTNDFNLNKIAELQGIAVLNINELANALKPVVLPGEMMEAKLIKEGKEHNQAVAYLDDGTMIVVDNARHLIGQTINVTVTSVLQTTAGRMIFAKLENSGHPNR
jgi:uncharacterized protein YacL